MEPRCPVCGGQIFYDLTCHTYGQGDRFFACLPCDSAIEYVCDGTGNDDECGWRYTHGLNPANPRAAANEAGKPAWLGDYDGNPMPGVRLIGC